MNRFPASSVVLGIAVLSLLVGTAKVMAAEPATAPKIASIEQLLSGLKARLEAQPNDMKGWVLLAQSYNHLGYRDEADNAAAKARALGYDGDIFPLPKGHPKVDSAGGSGTVKTKKHHHRSFVGSDAGSYVSSFFAEQEKQQESVKTPETDAEESQ